MALGKFLTPPPNPSFHISKMRTGGGTGASCLVEPMGTCLKHFKIPEDLSLWRLGQHCSGFWREAGAEEPRVSLPLLLLISWYAFVHGGHVRETGRIVFKASWGLCLGKQGMRVGVSASAFLPASSGMTTCNATPARSARAWPCSWAVWSSGMWPLGLSMEGAHASPSVLGSWPADFPPGWEVRVDM